MVTSQHVGSPYCPVPPTRLPPPFARVSPRLVGLFTDLLQDRVVEPAVGHIFLSCAFLVPNKDSNKFRLVVDLSQLNKFIVPRKIWMLTIRQVRLALRPGCWFASFILRDASWHVSVWPFFRKFLAVQVGCETSLLGHALWSEH